MLENKRIGQSAAKSRIEKSSQTIAWNGIRGKHSEMESA